MNGTDDFEGFKKFLIEERNFTTEQAAQHLQAIKDFNSFLKEKGIPRNVATVTQKEVLDYTSFLIKLNKNDQETILALLRYSLFKNNNEAIITLYEMFDGFNVMDALAEKVKEELGKEKWKLIFQGVTFPPLGSTNEERPAITERIIKRLEQNTDTNTCKKILMGNLHTGPPTEEYTKRQREKFLQAKNVDDFLEKRHKDYLIYLEGLMKEKKLYFTQEITPEVLEFVRNTPLISGVREGDIIYEIKIPYNTKEYLQATDDTMKRYHYCHCMWAKEGILNPKVDVPSTFCYCSAGYHHLFWEAAFGHPVDIELVETVVQGDPICKFAIHIPEEELTKLKGI